MSRIVIKQRIAKKLITQTLILRNYKYNNVLDVIIIGSPRPQPTSNDESQKT
jgi:hypothetical protein